jgi:hypothetical protein
MPKEAIERMLIRMGNKIDPVMTRMHFVGIMYATKEWNLTADAPRGKQLYRGRHHDLGAEVSWSRFIWQDSSYN